MTPTTHNIKTIYQIIINSIEEVRNAGSPKSKAKKFTYKFPHLYHIINGEIRKQWEGETNIMDKDWDNLIILDACRHDTFKKVIDLKDYDQLTSINSVGSHSQEFVQKTFMDKKFFDTVCVSANGFTADLAHNSFHKLIYTGKKGVHGHAPLSGLVPETVEQAGIRANQNYPNKRLIIHFMQPHVPYLGEKSKRLREELEQEGIIITQMDHEYKEDEHHDDYDAYTTLLHAAVDGHVSKSDLISIYEENLEIALNHVENVLDELEGKTVITADHGELLFEDAGWGRYSDPKYVTDSGKFLGHGRRIYTSGLREVPWMEITRGDRPKIVSEKPKNTEAIKDKAIEDQLQALGYKD